MSKQLRNLGFTEVKKEKDCIQAQNFAGDLHKWSLNTGKQVSTKKDQRSALRDILAAFEDELNVEKVEDLLAKDLTREIGLAAQQGMIIYR